jgi:D-alanyl-D-alanine carboxypeptidase
VKERGRVFAPAAGRSAVTTRNNTALVAFALAIAQGAQVTQAPPATVTQAPPATRLPDTPEGVDAFVVAEMARIHIPGLSLAVVSGGNVVKAKGYGFADVNRGEAVTPETVFRIGSMSKPFLAAGIMLLAQDRKLSIDDPISKYFAGTPSSWSSITVRHFLSHTSGVVREGPAYDKGKVKPDSVVVRSAYAKPLLFPTGSKYSYCNVCYFALADLITRASGTPWDVFLTQRVFKPQGMTLTQTTTAAPVPRSAKGYEWREASRLRNARYAEFEQNSALRPSGAFRSTVLDLARWDAALYRDDVLTRASREAMWTPAKLTDGTTSWYGLGWFVGSLNGHRWVGHGGNVNGFSAAITRFIDDSLTVIVLTNKDGEDVDIAHQVARAYLLERSVAMLRDRLARDNDTLDVQTRLAALYLSHESYEKALELLEQIVQRRPNDRAALLQLGFLGAEAHIALARAETALRAYLALPPTSGRGQGSGYPLAHYRLALIHEQRNEFDKARAELAAAIALYSEYKLARDAEQRMRGRKP